MKNLVFISYINRSGSTFLVNKLNYYNDIFICPEGGSLVNILLQFPDDSFSLKTKNILKKAFLFDDFLKFWKMPPTFIDNLTLDSSNFNVFIILITYLKNKIKADSSTVIFKGNNLFSVNSYINNMQVTDYNIKFIALLRDPRAIFNSQKKTKINNNPVITANQWNWYVKEINEIKNFRLIIFENLINNFEIEFEELIKYLGIDILNKKDNPDLYFLDNKFKTLHENINKEPDNELIYNWKQVLDKKYISIIQNYTKHGIEKFKYSIIPDSAKNIALLILYYKIRIFFKIDKY